MSSYQVNPGTFVCDYCLCHEKNGLPMFCEESKKTYHKEYFIAEARRKTKNGLISQLVEQEYEEYFSEQKEKEVEILFQEIMEPSSSKTKEEQIDETIELVEIPGNVPEECKPFIPQEQAQEKELQEQAQEKELQQTKIVSTSRYSNYIEIGLKFPDHKKYHLHAFVNNGSGFTVAKRFTIPEELWKEDKKRTATGVTFDGSHLTMNKVAKNVHITIGGGTFIIHNVWQSEGQGSDFLLGNDFILQQRFIQVKKR